MRPHAAGKKFGAGGWWEISNLIVVTLLTLDSTNQGSFPGVPYSSGRATTVSSMQYSTSYPSGHYWLAATIQYSNCDCRQTVRSDCSYILAMPQYDN